MELIVGGLPLRGEFEIDMQCKFVLKDALREGQKGKFSPDRKLKVSHYPSNVQLFMNIAYSIRLYVNFVGEGGIDTGGPWREFFGLLADELVHSPFFQCSEEGAVCFSTCNITGYRVGYYV